PRRAGADRASKASRQALHKGTRLPPLPDRPRRRYTNPENALVPLAGVIDDPVKPLVLSRRIIIQNVYNAISSVITNIDLPVIAFPDVGNYRSFVRSAFLFTPDPKILRCRIARKPARSGQEWRLGIVSWSSQDRQYLCFFHSNFNSHEIG